MAPQRPSRPSLSAPAAPLAPATSPVSFASLGLPAPLVAVLEAQGITSPFPIQAATLPATLAGRDVLGRGRTGSGKTLAFALPVVARLAGSSSRRLPRRPRALVLAPTRELASQISAVLSPLAAASGLSCATVFGGVSDVPQKRALSAGVDVLVACPGRLADLISQGALSLEGVEVTVLDEADHMADLGFLPMVKRLLDQTPRVGQRLLYSATLDNGVDVLVKRYMTAPETHSVDSAASPVTQMLHHVLGVSPADRLPVLVDLLAAPGRAVVFTRTKHGAKKLAKQLVQAGVPAVEMHGNLAQNARERNLAAFSAGTAKALVATDIAARGIHVDDVSLVVHADPPVEHKAYLHRSGRTARAGAEGTVVTLMLPEQRRDVDDLMRKAKIRPTTTAVGAGHPLLATLAPGDRSYVAAPSLPAQRPPAPASSTSRPSGSRSRRSGARPAGSAARGASPAVSAPAPVRESAPRAAVPGQRTRRRAVRPATSWQTPTP